MHYEPEDAWERLGIAVVRQAVNDLAAGGAPRVDAARYLVYLAEHLGVPVPREVLDMARQVLNRVPSTWAAQEASWAVKFGGQAWKEGPLTDTVCIRCGRRPATWRPVLVSPAHLGPERWRYVRPENHVPLCTSCAGTLWWDGRGTRLLLARATWGPRFDALAYLDGIWKSGQTIRWDTERWPLWPAEFAAGTTWETGLGTPEVRPPATVIRSDEHRGAAEEALERYPLHARFVPHSPLVRIARGQPFPSTPPPPVPIPSASPARVTPMLAGVAAR